MNAREHFAAAERLLAKSERTGVLEFAVQAQAHAELARAAAAMAPTYSYVQPDGSTVTYKELEQ